MDLMETLVPISSLGHLKFQTRLGEWHPDVPPFTILAKRELPTPEWYDSLMRTGLRFTPIEILRRMKNYFM
jgi:hypothetical protein